MSDGISRRSFIKVAAAAGAAAAVPGCEPAARKLIPYVVPDENVIPGIPSFYATVCSECPAGCGVVARVREGRVIKLEGNPADPISQGSICARGQASLQGLYNPDRLAKPMKRGTDGKLREVAWNDAVKLIADHLKSAVSGGSERVAVISGAQGPTLRKITERWLKAFNSSHHIVQEPISDAPDRVAAYRCFGRQDSPVYNLDKARVLLSFSADFVETWNSPVEMNRQFAAFRAPGKHGEETTNGYAVYVGPRFSLTAARCSEWIAADPGAEAAVAMGVLNVIVEQGWVREDAGIDRDRLKAFVAGFDLGSVSARTGVPAEKIRRIAGMFGKADGALAIAGTADEATHVAAMMLNAVTGNVGKTVRFIGDGLEAEPPVSTPAEIGAAIQAMKGGKVDVLVVTGANPCFSIPASAGFDEALRKVPLVVWCGNVPDETAVHASLLLPIHHGLERWDDTSPRAGVHGLAQPVMQPVFHSRALGDILLASAKTAGATGDIAAWSDTKSAIDDTWKELHGRVGGSASYAEFWEKALRAGGVFQTAATADIKLAGSALEAKPETPPTQGRGLQLFAFPHIFLYDGRGADKPWLQEIPEPVAQFVWDNWVQIHPETAKSLGVEQNDLVEIVSANGKIELPAFVDAGIHPGVLGVPIGQGHTDYGRYASNRGGNPWQLLHSDSFSVAVEAKKTGQKRKLVTPVGSSDMLGRSIVEAMSLEEYRKGIVPETEELTVPEPYELYEPYQYQRMWGMTIDVNACTGCSACVAACYAENNLPVVGKDEVELGRIMSWIRIDRYDAPKDKEGPPLYVIPMLCQQCNHAPCEPVCPVFASVHTLEGLNGQIYNRCVGTRYCENNCPYKVRRFNWYLAQWPEPLNLQLNPDVTVRGAGVMEKCTFCYQRIRTAELDVNNGPVADGAIVPACAQACPAKAITFGDMKNADSAMMRRRKDNKLRNYRALEELNTQPAIVYLRDIYRQKGRA